MSNGDKKREIVELAEDLFLRYGYKKTTLEDLSDRAGMTKSSLYHYFGGKEELFREASLSIMEKALDDLRLPLKRNARLEPGLLAFLDVLEKVIERIQPVNSPLKSEFGDVFGLIQNEHEWFDQEMTALLSGRLRRAMREDELKPDTPCEGLAILLLVVHGHIFSDRAYSRILQRLDGDRQGTLDLLLGPWRA